MLSQGKETVMSDNNECDGQKCNQGICLCCEGRRFGGRGSCDIKGTSSQGCGRQRSCNDQCPWRIALMALIDALRGKLTAAVSPEVYPSCSPLKEVDCHDVLGAYHVAGEQCVSGGPVGRDTSRVSAGSGEGCSGRDQCRAPHESAHQSDQQDVYTDCERYVPTASAGPGGGSVNQATLQHRCPDDDKQGRNSPGISATSPSSQGDMEKENQRVHSQSKSKGKRVKFRSLKVNQRKQVLGGKTRKGVAGEQDQIPYDDSSGGCQQEPDPNHETTQREFLLWPLGLKVTMIMGQALNIRSLLIQLLEKCCILLKMTQK